MSSGGVMLSSLLASSRTLESIDERLLRCDVSRRSFVKFCSSLMVASPFELLITDKKTPEEVERGLGKVIRPGSLTSLCLWRSIRLPTHRRSLGFLQPTGQHLL